MKHCKLLAISLLTVFAASFTLSNRAFTAEKTTDALNVAIKDAEKSFVADFKEKLATINDDKKQEYLQDTMLEAIDKDFRRGALALIEEGLDINCKLNNKKKPEPYTESEPPDYLKPYINSKPSVVTWDESFPRKRTNPWGRSITLYDKGHESEMCFDYSSFLEYAVLRGKAGFVDLYLNLNTDIDEDVLSDAFWQAVFIENPEIARQLVDSGFDLKKELERVNAKGWLLLEGTRDVIIWQLLLENGLDPNLIGSYPRELEKKICTEMQKNLNGYRGGYRGGTFFASPFIFQAEIPEIVKLLIKHGADLNVTGVYGQTILHEAAIYDADLISLLAKKRVLLIYKRVNVNAKDINDDTPLILFYKTNFGNIERMEPWKYYTYKNDGDIYKYHKKREFIDYIRFDSPAETLINNGADINAKNKEGMTALHYAAIRMDFHGIKLMTKNGGDINAQDNKGNTPLHIAAMHNHDESYIEIIIECGANVNIANNEGDTPLDILKRKHERLIGLMTLGASQVEKELNKIRDAGYPATCQELDTWYKQVPADQNGAEVVLKAIDKIVKWEEKDTPFEHPVSAKVAELAKAYGITNVEITDTPSNDLPEDWQIKNKELLPFMNYDIKLPDRTAKMSDPMKFLISDYLTDNDKALEILHKTTDCTKSRYPIDHSVGINAPMPPLQEITLCIRALSLEAVLHSENNQPDKAVQSFRSASAVAQTLNNEPAVISGLVKISSDRFIIKSLEYIFNHTELNSEQLNAIDRTLANVITHSNIKQTFIGDRCHGIDYFNYPSILAWITTPIDPQIVANMKTMGVLLKDELTYHDKMSNQTAQEVKRLLNKDLLAYLDIMNRQIDALDFPFMESKKAFEKIESDVRALPWYCCLTKCLGHSLGKANQMHYRHLTEYQIARTATAIEEYRLVNHDKYPEELAGLVPFYLENIPTDPFDQTPIKYIKLKTGYKLYSIGIDLVDNGGREFNDEGIRGEGTDITFIVEN